MFALYGGMETIGRVAGPMIAGGIAGAIAGPASWRWVFVIIAFAGIPVAIVTFLLTEPRRGRNEMEAVLGGELAEDEAELPISLSVAFERLRKIRSFYFFLVGLAALGFALFSLPLFINLILKDTYGLNAWHRGIFGSAVAIPAIAALAIAAPRSDALFRRSPPAALVFVGAMIGISGLVTIIGLYMPNVWILGVFFALGGAISQAAFVSIVAVVNAVIPYRLRSHGTAMVGVYVSLFGGFFGAVLTGMLADAFGPRTALTVVVVPASIVGGVLIAYGARFVRGDISRCVEELLEEKAEADRVRVPEAVVAAIQVRNLDFAYGTVQVLFDVNLDVRKGETVALLGTNGAGKSTLLRVISGLGVASRGAVRFHGRTITYADPEVRSRIGIVQLMGGNAVFSTLTVQENLRMAAFRYDAHEAQRRAEAALERFPGLADRRRIRAGDLSGGQQQMLALAMALVNDPEVLIIDELSLGLAPVTVQGLLEIVARAQGAGHDDDHRRAVPQRRPGDRRSRDLHGEGPDPLRRSGRRARRARRPRPSRVPRSGGVTSLLGFAVPMQVVLSGAMRGLAIGVFAVGIILIYRSNRVFNFALGELGALAAAIFVRLTVNYHWNFYAALTLTTVAGLLLGGLLELALVPRLRRAPKVILTVATLGAAQVFLFLQGVLPNISSYEKFPTAFSKQWKVGGVVIRAEHLVAIVVLPALVIGLAWFLNRSKHGTAVRAAADNPDGRGCPGSASSGSRSWSGCSPVAWPRSPPCSAPR